MSDFLCDIYEFASRYATHIATVVGFLLALLVKALLDFHLAFWIVKWFGWVPVRSLFRERTPDLHGSWSHTWSFAGASHADVAARHDNSQLYQFGSYVCCDHYADGVKYEFFGVIRNGYVSGIWHDAKSTLGYSGAFELRIVNENELRGIWIGHSAVETPGAINNNAWVWARNR